LRARHPDEERSPSVAIVSFRFPFF